MVWVAVDVADRLRKERGVYRAHEWRRFAEEEGFRCIVTTDLPEWQPAVTLGRRIYLQHRLNSIERCWWAWHELAHVAMHPGNFQFWERLSWGKLVLSKHEQQANDFALLFPVWNEG